MSIKNRNSSGRNAKVPFGLNYPLTLADKTGAQG